MLCLHNSLGVLIGTGLLYEQNGGAPEVGFAGGGVEDGYLAVVLAGWEAVDAEGEG